MGAPFLLLGNHFHPRPCVCELSVYRYSPRDRIRWSSDGENGITKFRSLESRIKLSYKGRAKNVIMYP